MKMLMMYIVCMAVLANNGAGGSEFRFSPRPNKANMIRWRQWGKEALEEAKRQNRPVLLSLSAVWCHWCHVMDETTYSDDEVIGIINERFVPVRVDADLRPDIDGLYNQGGWPSTVILTPEGELIDGGNYLPPDEMLARLKRAADIFAHDKERIALWIEKRRERLAVQGAGVKGAPGADGMAAVAGILKESFDRENGGFGSGQKFPNPDALEFALSSFVKTAEPELEKIITTTLDRMAAGGIHDRIEGGFFRYSTRPDWSEPHYEKMLDVNAGMISNYAHAYQALGKKEYKAVVETTVRYVLANLADIKSGGLYGSQDAEEAYYSRRDRSGLPAPAVDPTVYTDSTALMISALVSAHGAIGSASYLDMAIKAADFLIKNLLSGEEGAFHYFRSGAPGLKGMLLDNALSGAALLDVYNATGEKRFLAAANDIGRVLAAKFYDARNRRFLTTAGATDVNPVTGGALRDIQHNLANYRAAAFLSRLSHYPGSGADIKSIVDAALSTFSDEYAKFSPHAAAYGIALKWAGMDPVEITIIGDGEKARRFLSAANSLYIPEKVVRMLSVSGDAEEIRKLKYPLKEAVYLCTGRRCSRPITKPEKFKEEFKRFIEKPGKATAKDARAVKS